MDLGLLKQAELTNPNCAGVGEYAAQDTNGPGYELEVDGMAGAYDEDGVVDEQENADIDDAKIVVDAHVQRLVNEVLRVDFHLDIVGTFGLHEWIQDVVDVV